jgi:hypothetical protein
MAKTFTNPFTQTAQMPMTTFVNADSFTATQPGTAPTNTKLFFTAGADGSVLKAMIATTDATAAAQTFGIWLSTDAGTTKTLLGVVNVPLNSGYTGAIAAVDCLNSTVWPAGALQVDQSGKAVLTLPASARIYVGCLLTAVAASKTIYITGFAQDF